VHHRPHAHLQPLAWLCPACPQCAALPRRRRPLGSLTGEAGSLAAAPSSPGRPSVQPTTVVRGPPPRDVQCSDQFPPAQRDCLVSAAGERGTMTLGKAGNSAPHRCRLMSVTRRSRVLLYRKPYPVIENSAIVIAARFSPQALQKHIRSQAPSIAGRTSGYHVTRDAPSPPAFSVTTQRYAQTRAQ
jgi:hypothetical protein